VDAVHDLLAFARLYVGEGSCMAAEAACLGTPAIFLSPASRRGYLDALEQRYGHVTTVQTVSQALQHAREWLTPGTKETALAARDRLVRECEDPVEFTMRVIRRYGRG
jgi:predicted glycosyltransferase